MTRRRSKVGGKRATRKPQLVERGPGRPALGDAKRSRSIRVRVTPAFELRVQEAAAAAEMSVSDWGLDVLERKLGVVR